MHLKAGFIWSSPKMNAGKIVIKCPEPDGPAHPHCPHGPTLLVSHIDSTDENSKGYFVCAASRDQRLCSYQLPEDALTPEKLQKRYNLTHLIEEYRRLRKQLLNAKEKMQYNFCFECNVPLMQNETAHGSHAQVRNISEEWLRDPTQFLRPLDNNKVQAQYFFDERSLAFFAKCFEDMKIDKVVCMGAPRLHAYLRQKCSIMKTFLLDFDHRFFYFYDDSNYAWYNMCNNFFFDQQQKAEFQQFLKQKNYERLLIFTDPPFGCRTEPIACTIRQVIAEYNAVNQRPYQPVPIFWIFPYFADHYIQKVMPELEMCDYRVNYTNHESYTNVGSKARKLGSPVRIFTNVPLNCLQLPVQEYKYCASCERYSALENQHCHKCGCCPSKNGSTYRHCNRCGICVKPTYVHCANCRRCTQVDGHNCEHYQMNQRCWICLCVGHIERSCPIWQEHCNGTVLQLPHNDRVIICMLCGCLGHNERHCKQRRKYLQGFKTV